MRGPILWALLAGLMIGLGQAPFGVWPGTLLGLAGLLVLIARATLARRALVLGWVAGAAHFAFVLSWIIEPFLVDVATHGWMAPFALILMAGGMALFWALPAWLGWRAGHTLAGRVGAVAALVLAGEILRGVLFTGFPWALLGHVWIDTPVAQLAALGGAPLLSALTLTLAGLLALAWMRGALKPRRAAAALIAAVALAGVSWAWGMVRTVQPVALTDTRVRLVQANIPQHLKWQRDLLRDHFLAHLDLSQGDAPVDLVLWPETAAPFFLDTPADGLQAVADAAGVPVLLGIDRRGRSALGAVQYFNSAALIGPDGAVQAVYDKHHLVPFGEYIPLVGAWADSAGIGGLAARLVSGYTPGAGPQVLDLGRAGRVLPLICYEAIFPRNLRTAERPDWIAHLTNDAWFGQWLGPQQHLAQAQLRAIETGLPVLRAANTGISAVIDPYGQVLARLDLGVRGALDARVPAVLVQTPYGRWGDGPWWLWAGFVVLFSLWRARKRRGA